MSLLDRQSSLLLGMFNVCWLFHESRRARRWQLLIDKDWYPRLDDSTVDCFTNKSLLTSWPSGMPQRAMQPCRS
eukprot:3326278-Amphidinium_carterae.1